MNRSRRKAGRDFALIISATARSVFVIGALALMVLLLLPAKDLPQVGLWDKLEHGLSFGILASTGAVAFPGRRSLAWLAFALPCLSLLCEFLQRSVPGRWCSLEDALANTIGIGVGLVPFMIFWQGRLPRLRSAT